MIDAESSESATASTSPAPFRPCTSFHYAKTAIRLAFVLWAAPLLSGCAPDAADIQPRKIAIKRGNAQCGIPGHDLKTPLMVEVLGPRRRGLLGGKGVEPPVPNVPVKFRILPPERSASLTAEEVKTDHGGFAATQLKLGSAVGDYFVEAIVEAKDGTRLSTRFRATAGLIPTGGGQEGRPGSVLPDPLVVTAYDAKGNAQPGLTVHFCLEGEGNGAKLKKTHVVTDSEGRAETYLQLGKHSGAYHVSAQVFDPECKYVAGAVRFEAFAVNIPGVVVTVLGGLAIFIFGMRIMSESLQRVAGSRLRSVLHTMTGNRFMGLLSGLGITALIQSSSATTVMVVGFINAGLLTLKQAVGVVMGANIGTTVTAQIISFKLDRLALPCIAAGLLISLAGKRTVTRSWGSALMGFGLLFLGMTTMSSVLKPLAHSPKVMDLFASFDCTPKGGVMPFGSVVCAVAIGTLVTVVVQSSSATVGLVMALAFGGLINFWTAVPLVLGDNIGTTITAALASLGANRNAKRAACAHALFNALGAGYMVALFYLKVDGMPVFLKLVDYVTPGDVFSAQPVNIERHIANAHTLFNIVNCIIFIPLVDVMVFLCMRVLPLKSDESETSLQYLEPHLLDTPYLALPQAVNEVAWMCRQSRKAIADAYKLFQTGDSSLARKVSQREDTIDRLQEQITEYLTELSTRRLTETESPLIPALLHAVNDAERIGDHSENLVELALRRYEAGHKFSPRAQEELDELYGLIEGQFQHVLDALNKRDTNAAKLAKKEDEALINRAAERLAESHARRLEVGECDVLSGIIFLDIVANLEKVGDHLANIGSRALLAARIADGVES